MKPLIAFAVVVNGAIVRNLFSNRLAIYENRIDTEKIAEKNKVKATIIAIEIHGAR
jgi:DNA-binding protein